MPDQEVTGLEVPALAITAYLQFNELLDYIWKTPEFIEQQKQRELRLFAGSSGQKEARFRWDYESAKLDEFFPMLLATSNVFLVGSLLEFHLQQLLERTSPSERTGPHRGVREVLRKLKASRLPVETVLHWPSVDALIRLRNCLIHSAGFLDRSRDGESIREIVAKRTFLEPLHSRESAKAYRNVRIVKSKHGDRLVVTNEYSWLAAAYSRDFIVEICGGMRPA